MLENIKGLGPKRIESLHAANIRSLRDILYYFPYRYKDTSKITSIASIAAGDTVCIECFLQKKIITQYFNGLNRSIAMMGDQSGSIKCIWYNAPWIRSKIIEGKKFLLYGRVYLDRKKLYLSNPSIEEVKGIIPIYKKIPNISNNLFSKLVKIALEEEPVDTEIIPSNLEKEYNLLSIKESLKQKHFPTTFELLAKANQKLTMEGLLVYLESLEFFKSTKTLGIKFSKKFLHDDYWNSLAFEATGDQRKALKEITEDLQSNKALMRLVQGDVGSGKTAVALGAALHCLQNGYQCAFMAPTEVLARQLYQEAKKTLDKYGFSVGLLNSTLKQKEKKEMYQRIECGNCQMIVGTHALFSDAVVYQNLGLIITDEQHRFGVAQRKFLQNKATDNRRINVLVMSATPIPRSTALILLSDLDVSLIKEMPKGRIPVETALVPEQKRDAMYEFIAQQVASGKQAFIVCKHIEESDDDSDIIDVKTHFKNLSEGMFKHLNVGILHGKQKQEEKESNILAFSQRKLDILISTTVVEVGVNVPNANVIVIENADMYGLAQLHQLRGRVGRDGSKAWCFLMAKKNDRLDKFCKTNDGFEISKIDFFSRGPGELLGLHQHGESILSTLLLNDSAENIITACKEIYEKIKNNESYSQNYDAIQRKSKEQIAYIKDKITFA